MYTMRWTVQVAAYRLSVVVSALYAITGPASVTIAVPTSCPGTDYAAFLQSHAYADSRLHA